MTKEVMKRLFENFRFISFLSSCLLIFIIPYMASVNHVYNLPSNEDKIANVITVSIDTVVHSFYNMANTNTSFWIWAWWGLVILLVISIILFVTKLIKRLINYMKNKNEAQRIFS